MILPQSAFVVLLVMIFALFCLGSWANTYKLAGKRRWELYYFDWVFGVLAVALVIVFTFGSLGFDGFSFTDDLMIASKRGWLLAFAAGVIFNLGNMLLLAALSVAGMAVAYSLALGVAIIVAAIVGFAIDGSAPLLFLVPGCALMLGGVVASARIYQDLIRARHEEIARAGKAKSTRRPGSGKAVILGTISGLLLGSFFPLLDRARAGETGLGPYSAGFLFVLGVVLSTFLFNLFFMNLPVEGEPLEIPDYFRGTVSTHLPGLAGGALWCAGMMAGMVAVAAPAAQNPHPAMAQALARSVLLVGAVWGILAWKELKDGDTRIRLLTMLMLLLAAGGIAVLSVAPLYAAK